jgi:hypothetical protein
MQLWKSQLQPMFKWGFNPCVTHKDTSKGLEVDWYLVRIGKTANNQVSWWGGAAKLTILPRNPCHRGSVSLRAVEHPWPRRSCPGSLAAAVAQSAGTPSSPPEARPPRSWTAAVGTLLDRHAGKKVTEQAISSRKGHEWNMRASTVPRQEPFWVLGGYQWREPAAGWSSSWSDASRASAQVMVGTGGACGFRGYAGSAMLLLAPAFEGYVGCVWGGARAV